MSLFASCCAASNAVWVSPDTGGSCGWAAGCVCEAPKLTPGKVTAPAVAEGEPYAGVTGAVL